MMIVNRQKLFDAAPIKDMEPSKIKTGVVTAGMSEAGYDICIKQTIKFYSHFGKRRIEVFQGSSSVFSDGRFTLASAIEKFQMPNDLVGIVHDKSSWARCGLSVFNTVIEPGWKGFLTLELVYHGDSELIIPAGSGIAQVVFHQVTNPVEYSGRYQNQADKPVPAIDS